MAIVAVMRGGWKMWVIDFLIASLFTLELHFISTDCIFLSLSCSLGKGFFSHLMQCGFQSPPPPPTEYLRFRQENYHKGNNYHLFNYRMLFKITGLVYLGQCLQNTNALYFRKLIKKWNTSAVKLAWDAKTEEIRKKCKCNGLDTILLFSSQKTLAHKREKVIFLLIPLFHTSPPF